jgi:hypothetical protein
MPSSLARQYRHAQVQCWLTCWLSLCWFLVVVMFMLLLPLQLCCPHCLCLPCRGSLCCCHRCHCCIANAISLNAAMVAVVAIPIAVTIAFATAFANVLAPPAPPLLPPLFPPLSLPPSPPPLLLHSIVLCPLLSSAACSINVNHCTTPIKGWLMFFVDCFWVSKVFFYGQGTQTPSFSNVVTCTKDALMPLRC